MSARRTFVRCARCGQRKHRLATVYSRHTGNFYCFDSIALQRCEAIVEKERTWIEETFGDRAQGALSI